MKTRLAQRQAAAKWQKEHPEKTKEARKRFKERHPEARKEAAKRYRAKHPKVDKEARKAYKKKHPEAQYYYRIRGKCNKLGLEYLTVHEFIFWLNNQGWVCHYCGGDIKRGSNLASLTVDRLDPTKGYTEDNMVLACRRCNIIKGNWFTEKQMLEIADFYLRGV